MTKDPTPLKMAGADLWLAALKDERDFLRGLTAPTREQRHRLTDVDREITRLELLCLQSDSK